MLKHLTVFVVTFAYTVYAKPTQETELESSKDRTIEEKSLDSVGHVPLDEDLEARISLPKINIETNQSVLRRRSDEPADPKSSSIEAEADNEEERSIEASSAIPTSMEEERTGNSGSAGDEIESRKAYYDTDNVEASLEDSESSNRDIDESDLPESRNDEQEKSVEINSRNDDSIESREGISEEFVVKIPIFDENDSRSGDGLASEHSESSEALDKSAVYGIGSRRSFGSDIVITPIQHYRHSFAPPLHYRTLPSPTFPKIHRDNFNSRNYFPEPSGTNEHFNYRPIEPFPTDSTTNPYPYAPFYSSTQIPRNLPFDMFPKSDANPTLTDFQQYSTNYFKPFDPNYNPYTFMRTRRFSIPNRKTSAEKLSLETRSIRRQAVKPSRP